MNEREVQIISLLEDRCSRDKLIQYKITMSILQIQISRYFQISKNFIQIQI